MSHIVRASVVAAVAIACLGSRHAMAGPAPDLTGRWHFTMEPDFRGNRAVIVCNIGHKAPSVIVQCGKGVEMKGTLHKDVITFQTPPMTADKLVASYRANVSDGGRRLTGTWRLVGGVLNERGKFKADKQQP